MLIWIIENKEWVFSGVGIVILSGLFSLVKRKGNHKPLKFKKISGNSQKINGNNNTQTINIASPASQNKAILKVMETLRHDAHTVEFKFINKGEISAYISKIILHLSFEMFGPVRILGHKRAYVYGIRVLHPDENAISALDKLSDKEKSLNDYYGLMKDIEGKSMIVARLEGKSKNISRLEIPVSQEVPAKGIDRVILTFGSNANPPLVYKGHAQFLFNDGESVISDKFDVCL